MGEKIKLFVGTYTESVLCGDGSIFKGKGEGVYYFEFDAETGSAELRYIIDQTKNPSYVAFNCEKSVLYVVNEMEQYKDEESGFLKYFYLTEESFTELGEYATGGTDPCHVAVVPDGKALCVSNYMSGSMRTFDLDQDGHVTGIGKHFDYSGKGSDPIRQEGPHCHSVAFDRDKRYAFAIDLGTDRICCYNLDPRHYFEEKTEQCITLPGGAGPRVCRFNGSGTRMYVGNELNNTITVFKYDSITAETTWIQTVKTTEDADCCNNTFADIQFSPDGRFLYASNRGADTLVCFGVDKENGTLEKSSVISCGGKTPRSFAVDPTGRYLICANQDSDNLAIFSIGQTDGHLEQIRQISVGSPVCVIFA